MNKMYNVAQGSTSMGHPTRSLSSPRPYLVAILYILHKNLALKSGSRIAIFQVSHLDKEKLLCKYNHVQN